VIWAAAFSCSGGNLATAGQDTIVQETVHCPLSTEITYLLPQALDAHMDII